MLYGRDLRTGGFPDADTIAVSPGPPERLGDVAQLVRAGLRPSPFCALQGARETEAITHDNT